MGLIMDRFSEAASVVPMASAVNVVSMAVALCVVVAMFVRW